MSDLFASVAPLPSEAPADHAPRRRPRRPRLLLPTDPWDRADLKRINERMRVLDHQRGILVKLKGAIMARARSAWEVRNLPPEHPSIRIDPAIVRAIIERNSKEKENV